MKTVEIQNIYKFLKYSIPIGKGQTAICFLLPDKTVAKIFYNSYCYDFLYELEEVRNKIELLASITNDTFVGPDKVIIKNGICIGYIYPYIKAKTLHKISPCTSVPELLKNYDKLYEDSKKISNLGFQLRDLHDKNILYSDSFKVIDLDKGGKSLIYDTKDELLACNMKKINNAIIEAIFKINFGENFGENINFYNDTLQDLYIDSISENCKNFPLFLEKMANECPKNQDIKTLRKKISYHKTKNYYYL